jgi:hypothetical protein
MASNGAARVCSGFITYAHQACPVQVRNFHISSLTHSTSRTSTLQRVQVRNFHISSLTHSTSRTSTLQRVQVRNFHISSLTHSTSRTSTLQRVQVRNFHISSLTHSTSRTSTLHATCSQRELTIPLPIHLRVHDRFEAHLRRYVLKRSKSYGISPPHVARTCRRYRIVYMFRSAERKRTQIRIPESQCLLFSCITYQVLALQHPIPLRPVRLHDFCTPPRRSLFTPLRSTR